MTALNSIKSVFLTSPQKLVTGYFTFELKAFFPVPAQKKVRSPTELRKKINPAVEKSTKENLVHPAPLARSLTLLTGKAILGNGPLLATLINLSPWMGF